MRFALVAGFEALPVAKLQLLRYPRGGVIGADMRCELFVAPLFVVTLHLIERIPCGRTRRVELPCTFGASPAVKILSFDPYQFAALCLHGASPGLVWSCFYGKRLALVFQAHCDDEVFLGMPQGEILPKLRRFESGSEWK